MLGRHADIERIDEAEAERRMIHAIDVVFAPPPRLPSPPAVRTPPHRRPRAR